MPETSRTWTVDSIEEGIAAVQEDGGRMVRLPLWLLPDGVREGEIVSVARREEDGAAALTVRIDREATERALRRSREQVEKAPPGKDPGGHIQL